MEVGRTLKTESDSYRLKRPSTEGSLHDMVAACISEKMNAATSFHKLHLKLTGSGSYAAHKALNDLYVALPDLADTLAEGYQGAAEVILTYKEMPAKELGTVADGIKYIKELYEKVNGLQAQMPYSEIVNDLDLVKTTLNSAKYKLLFLK